VYREQFLASIKDRLVTAAVKRRALDLCQELFLADGARSDEEEATRLQRDKIVGDNHCLPGAKDDWLAPASPSSPPN
jgi:hypothetical protein